MAQFFIDRPIFAWVIALFIMAAGALSITQLPIAQYPAIAPPEVVIRVTYPGATAAVIDQSITSIVEQELNGAEGLLFVESVSQANGTASITATFRPGTNPDLAAVDVQNRLKRVEARLPPEVVRQGLPVEKARSNFLLFIALSSRNPDYDPTALGDYLSRNVINEIRRVPGVGQAQLFGSERAMRVWIDTARLESLGMDPADVLAIIRAQNLQVAAGGLGERPSASSQPIAANIVVRGQLPDVEAFREIRVRANPDGSIVRLRDVARVELGAASYATSSRLNGRSNAAIGVQLSPSGNALATAKAVHARMEELARYLPPGVSYAIPYDTSGFVRLSIRAVVETLLEAIVLVFLVMYLFLQNWRATLIPTMVVPVALLGTFGVMLATGGSINVLTMFGLVLAIGILVDDAIVVIENVERIMREEGLPPREATRKAMGQIQPALVGITLVLVAVFTPMAFFGGAVGTIYRQFTLSMVSAIGFSLLMALSLTPALCATFIKPAAGGEKTRGKRFFGAFNRGFERTSNGYGRFVDRLLGWTGRSMIVYLAIVAVMALLYVRLPTAFLPQEDQGYLLTNIELPPAASSNRTEQVIAQAEKFFLDQPAVANVVGVIGFSFAGQGQNAGLAFVTLKDWHDREERADALAQRALGALMGSIRDAIVFTLNPPSVPGLGATSGFSLRLQDRGGAGLDALASARDRLLQGSAQSGVVTGVRVEGLGDAPQLLLDIDRDKASAQGVTMADIGDALGAAFGSAYVNDFPNRGRLQRVIVQAEFTRRMQPEDISRLTVRNSANEMVPFSTFSNARWVSGPVQVVRYNGYPAYRISGQAKPGYSSGDAMAEMESLMGELPASVGHEWTGQSYQERLAGNQAPLLYALSAAAVFLCLAALYESWSVPFAVMLVVPLGILGTVLLTTLTGMANDVYFKVGLLTVMGLSAKNAILIIEFARTLHDSGRDLREATLEAARLRLRPILMTSLAFILGVVPLMIATGASSASQRAIGTAVFGGMVTGTLLALVLVPVFFVVVRGRTFIPDRLRAFRFRRSAPHTAPALSDPAPDSERPFRPVK